MEVRLSATMAIKTALRQVEWVVHARMFLELLLHCKYVILADRFVPYNMITSKENIFFYVTSRLMIFSLLWLKLVDTYLT